MRARFVFEAAFPLLVTLGGRVPVEEADEQMPAEDEHEVEPEPAGPPRKASRRLSWPWRRRSEASASPTAADAARPARPHDPCSEPQAKREVGDAELEEGAPAAAEAPSHSDEAPGPVVTKRPLDVPGLEQPPVVPASRPRRAFARAARRVAQTPPPATPPPAPPAREWNLWDLERRAREQAGNAPRDEEWSALFTHLRVFANADGVLPKEFDALVRESFGELIEAA